VVALEKSVETLGSNAGESVDNIVLLLDLENYPQVFPANQVC